jgi:hypothetical protein
MLGEEVMWKLFAALAVCAALATPARADCVVLTEIVQKVEALGFKNVVLRGPAVDRWLEVYASQDIHVTVEKPEFVWIVLIPQDKAALVGIGQGDRVCDALRVPLEVVNMLMHEAAR